MTGSLLIFFLGGKYLFRILSVPNCGSGPRLSLHARVLGLDSDGGPTQRRALTPVRVLGALGLVRIPDPFLVCDDGRDWDRAPEGLSLRVARSDAYLLSLEQQLFMQVFFLFEVTKGNLMT